MEGFACKMGCDIQREELPFLCLAHLLPGSLDLTLDLTLTVDGKSGACTAGGRGCGRAHRSAFTSQLCASGTVQS